MTSYQEKLTDPRWQKKRLLILNRDNWTCQICKDKKSTLTVHHISYNGYIDPWEYDNYMLVTLCETCHTKEHDTYKSENSIFNNRENGLMNIEFYNILYEFLWRIGEPFNTSADIYPIDLPNRIIFLRKSNQKKFEKVFQKSKKIYLKNLSEKDRQETYNLSKKGIGEQYLTHKEYEDRIKKLATELGI